MFKSLLITVATLAVCTSAFAATGKPAAAVLAKHKAIMGADECQADLEDESETYQLNANKQLVIIPCYMGAYQGSARAYIVSNSTYIEQVMVLAYDESAKSVAGTLDLTSADYHEASQTLSTFAKGRGIGDCGQGSKSKITADEYTVSVKTVEIFSKADCDGDFDKEWPVVFKQ
jgi:hypothetical protein